MRDKHSHEERQPVHHAVVNALQTWVERHPNPDVPALSIAAAGQFTPRQLLQEVLERSETGLFLEEMIETAAGNGPAKLEEILSSFEGSEPTATEPSSNVYR
jgi:hypothetical protein